MAGIGEKTLSSAYGDLLQMDNSNNGIGTSLVAIKDGAGTESCLQISDDQVFINPVNDDTNRAVRIRSNSGTDLLVADSTNLNVKVLGNHVNTQYAKFCITSIDSAAFAAGYHQAVPLSGCGIADLTYPPHFSNSADPATSFTTAHGNGTKASDLVPCMWYLPDAISIDGVSSIEGADTATGDTTRMHLIQYEVTRGAPHCLTSGTIVAHSSGVTNAGDEQPYSINWTVDSAAVASGQVLIATFESAGSINSDYSLQITVKYHLT